MSDDTRAELAHLLRRAAFAATPALLDAYEPHGYEAAVDALLAPGPAAAPPELEPVDRKDRKAVRAQTETLQLWWLDRMVTTPQPLAERLTLFWHGHWATSVQKVRSAALMLRQNQTLRSLGTGDFRELARAMVRDPALMIWLDAPQNKTASPNENLGRELMELFTLGIGSYTDDDVKAAARALTGWRLSKDTGTARFVPKDHDSTPKTILGTTAAYDDRSLVDLLTGVDAGRAFVARRLWFRLAFPAGPDEATAARLDQAYGPSRDVKGLVRALLLDPSFRSARHSLVKEPVAYAVGAMRALNVRPAKVKGLLPALTGLGQTLFAPPSVGGWPANQGWLATSAAQTRVAFARTLAAAADLSAVEKAAKADRPELVRTLLGVDAWTARTSAALKEAAGSPAQLVALAVASPENVIA